MSALSNITPLYRLSAPNHPSSPRVCRETVAAVLQATGATALVDTARLLVSEAVTNVHRHAEHTRAIHIDVLVQDGAAVIAVKDNDPDGVPLRRPVNPHGEGGRGLLLVEELAYRWGVTWLGGEETDRKQVWFELRAPE
ncbi:ATP-binding protein [Streptomyces pactum]|uniref:ATP-binding protein n=1 Tax=Streptomyces pactum TaxID=68249 RepID=A0ABS0NHT4_9ACTN|nr:ATP-binding protein [Streptomyces pactum]MBH5334749.1 ATP-binding protein [Streptomyces pactum]